MPQSPSVGSGAVGDEPGDASDETIEQESDQPDVDERDDDVGEARGVPGVPDEEADADAAGQHFGRDDGEPGQPDPDAQAGEDIGRRRRDHDLVEELEMVEPQNGGDIAIILRNVADADRGIDDD